MVLERTNFSPGQTVHNYKIEQLVGHGGMGVVAKAVDLRLHRPVALKFLSSQLSSNHEAIQQFRREAVLSSNINHPGICTIFAIESIESLSFIVMEYLEGETLSQTLKNNGPLPEPQVLGIVYQLCNALKAAHSAGVVHRDIKPENIMLCPKTQQIKIMDFGVAKLAENLSKDIYKRMPLNSLKQNDDSIEFTPNQLSITLSGFMGTSSYMSPEQCLGKPIDHRSDIFSLGILIYELLTNEKPFKGNNHIEIMRNIVEHGPIPVNEINSDLKYNWCTIIDKALEKDATKRFQSIEEFENKLDQIKTKKYSENSFFFKSKKRTLVTFITIIINLVILVGFIWGRQSLSKNQNQNGDFLGKALYCLEQRDWDGAGTFAQKAIEQGEKKNNPKMKSSAYSILGRIMYQKGYQRQAIECFENAVRLYPQDINTSVQLAEIYTKAGNIDGAKMILQNILKSPIELSDRVLAYSSMGSLLVYSGKFVEGLDYLNNALDLCFESKEYSNIYSLLQQISEILLEFSQPLLVEKKRLELKKKLEQLNFSNDSVRCLIDLTIPLKLAISKDDWKNAESLLGLSKNIDGKVLELDTIYFLLKRGQEKDIYLLEEKIKSDAYFIENMPVDLKYNIAYYYASQGEKNKAVALLEEIIQTKKIFITGFPLYYNKALALLSEIYEVSGFFKHSEELCNKFLKNWENADPELLMLNEIKARYKRVKNKNISSSE